MHRSGLTIMTKLLKFVTPFAGIMTLTIIMGVLGFLVAIGITVVGAVGILDILDLSTISFLDHLKTIYICLAIFAIMRGVLRYLEQSSGHYIAFKLLAFIRDKVFKTLRRLAPGKLDGRDSGQLIALITSDIELLEVFFAHTIAPIAIGIITCLIMLGIIGHYSLILMVIALFAYLLIGLVIPYFTAKKARNYGRSYRENVGELNQYFLESVRGMREIILFNQGAKRRKQIAQKSTIADLSVKKIKAHEGITRAITEASILSLSALMLYVSIFLCMKGEISFTGFFISLVCLMSSYGPVVALSNLSNSLLQTLASGERVLDLLEEAPETPEVIKGQTVKDTSITVDHITFSYDDSPILSDLSLHFNKGEIIGIVGKSGSGKSTLLKLIMYFYEVQSGSIQLGETTLNELITSDLRRHTAYVTQDTYLFDATIEENLRVAKRDATMEELIIACTKANIYEFIQSLPLGFNSKVGELGDSLSGGERQRLGIARAFLSDAPIILLDEPTSNLDSLNESIILKALKESREDKTIILVSHRSSTMSIADTIFYMKEGRAS